VRLVQTGTAYIPQLLKGLAVTENGIYFISRASAAKVLQADVERNFGNGSSFDETLDLVLVECNYDPTEPKFSLPDETGNRHIPLDVAVGSWLKWATGGSEQAKLLLCNLALAGLINLFEKTLKSKADNT
jgi:hypothetical protein